MRLFVILLSLILFNACMSLKESINSDPFKKINEFNSPVFGNCALAYCSPSLYFNSTLEGYEQCTSEEIILSGEVLGEGIIENLNKIINESELNSKSNFEIIKPVKILKTPFESYHWLVFTMFGEDMKGKVEFMVLNKSCQFPFLVNVSQKPQLIKDHKIENKNLLGKFNYIFILYPYFWSYYPDYKGFAGFFVYGLYDGKIGNLLAIGHKHIDDFLDKYQSENPSETAKNASKITALKIYKDIKNVLFEN